jgi:sialic acid synthase SpsE
MRFYAFGVENIMGVEFRIGSRVVGDERPPLVIAEIGINHEGSYEKASRMVDDAAAVGCECVKFQTHIVDDEMIENDVVPGNARESIWSMMKRCALSAEEEVALKRQTEARGMIFLSTPFSRAAADRLNRIGVPAFKIGSGECNNYPLIEHIASFRKPVILSTGMNDMPAIRIAVEILRRKSLSFSLLHCSSVYPTPYSLVRLGAIAEMKAAFPDALLGLSDHSLTIYPCLGAVALGARILERHFTSDKKWPGPDIEVSMDPIELRELITGSAAIFSASGGTKGILAEEAPTIAFAYASVVSIANIAAGDVFDERNIWVKRPGTGEIRAESFGAVLGKRARENILKDSPLRWSDIDG